MNTRFTYLAMGLLLVAVTMGGCNSKLKKERDDLYQQNLQLQDELSTTRSALATSDGEKGNLMQQLADLQNEIDTMNDPRNRPAPVATSNQGMGNLGAGVTVNDTRTKVTIRVSGDILFDSGKVTLKAAAKRTLARIAQAINSQYPGNVVRVEGHSDADPIRKSKWRDNYQLSEARAAAVRDYLVTKGVSRSSLMILGHGPDVPVASNKTATGKRQNRRVEIVVVK